MVFHSLKRTASCSPENGMVGRRSFSFWEFAYFQGRLLLVSGRYCKWLVNLEGNQLRDGKSFFVLHSLGCPGTEVRING